MSDVLTAEQVDEEVNRALTALSALARSHEALREREQQYHNLWHDETDRAELAEQRADEAEKALRDIASLPDQSEAWNVNDVAVVIARAALAAAVVSAEPTEAQG